MEMLWQHASLTQATPCVLAYAMHVAAAGAIQNSKGGKGLLISGAQLTASTSTSALVGPATAAHGHAKYTGLTFNK